MTTNPPTPQQVHDAGKVLRHTSFCHRRTAIRPANEAEAQAIAITWATIFARYDLQHDDLIEGVNRRATTEAQAPEPAEIVAHARAVRTERASREQAIPELRDLHEAKIDAKIHNFAGQFGLRLER